MSTLYTKSPERQPSSKQEDVGVTNKSWRCQLVLLLASTEEQLGWAGLGWCVVQMSG